MEVYGRCEFFKVPSGIRQFQMVQGHSIKGPQILEWESYSFSIFFSPFDLVRVAFPCLWLVLFNDSLMLQ